MFLVGPNTCQQLLNWMLAIACQQGHLDIVKLLIRAYSADPESCAVRRNEFPVLIRLPLYAAIKAGLYLQASTFCPSSARSSKNGLSCSHAGWYPWLVWSWISSRMN